ncbi:hypothetical protein VTK56DRAFT_286 [Thermocarpiscus australiensis]
MSNSSASAAPSGSAGAPPAQTGSLSRPPGPPYPPHTAQLGGIPTVIPDVPVSVVFLSLFVAGAALNLIIFQRNWRRNHRFLFSIFLFGFCVARIAALAMRIAWATDPRGVRVALAAEVFTSAGVLILFVINLAFTQRIIRAYHPGLGRRKPVTLLFAALFASALLILVMVVTVTVHSAFTLDPHTLSVDRSIQLFCVTYLAVYAALPIPLVALAAASALPHQQPRRRTTTTATTTVVDKRRLNDYGRFRTTLALLTGTAALLAAGAIFRAAVAYQTRPAAAQHPAAWFHSRACYYLFDFGIEILVVYAYTLARFDRRFYVPRDGGGSSSGRRVGGDYARAGRGSPAAAAPVLVGVGLGVDGVGLERREPVLLAYGGADQPWTGMAGKTESRPSSSRSERSERRRSSSGSSSYGEGPSEGYSLGGRDSDLDWVARAMRELYGDDEDEGEGDEEKYGQE